MKEFTIKLNADVNDLMAQFKKGSKELKKFADGVVQAENKLNALQETGAYLAQIDKALSQLSSKYPNVFESIFGDVNAQIKKSLEPIVKSGATIQQIGKQLEGISTGKIEATNTEMKQLGETVRLLSKNMGTNVNLDFLDGTEKAQVKAKKLIGVMSELANSYSLVNKGKAKQKATTSGMSYDQIYKTVQEVKKLSKLFDDGNDSALDKMDGKISKMSKSFKLTEDEMAQVEVLLQDLDISVDKTVEKLQKMLGERFPPQLEEGIKDTADTISKAGKEMESLASTIKLPNSADFEKTFFPSDEQISKVRELAEEYRVIYSLLQKGGLDNITSNALVERAKSIEDVIYKITGADSTPSEMLKGAYGLSGITPNIFGRVDKAGMQESDNASRQKAIDLIQQEIAAEQELARAKAEVAAVEKQGYIDTFAEKYQAATEEAKNSLKEMVALQKAIRDLDDQDISDKEYNSKHKEYGERYRLAQDNLEKIDPELFDASLDLGLKDTLNTLQMLGVELSGVSSSQPFEGVEQSAKGATVAIEEQTEALRERNRVEQEDYDEDIQKENGALEEKLELLRDIADQYGSNITQRDRNTYAKLEDKDATEEGLTSKETDRFYELQEKIEAADSSLEEFGATYDKIILKLENGKKIEILPDDEGLRKLLKFSDEGMGEAYNGIQVEDVIFQRAEGAANAMDEAATAAANLGAQIDEVQGGQSFENVEQGAKSAGASIESLKAKAEEAKAKFLELTNSLDADLFAGRYDEFSLGKGDAELEQAKNELQELANAGHLTADAMAEVDAAYNKTKSAISASYEGLRNENMYKEDAGSYDRGYELGYQDAMNNAQHDSSVIADLEWEKKSLQNEIESLRSQLNNSQQGSGAIVDMSAEEANLEQLRAKLESVKGAIEAKTEAFTAEGQAVDSTVTQEVAALEKLQAKLTEIAAAVDNIGQINLGATINEVDSILAKLADPSNNIEYLGMLNSKTGKVSDELFSGTNGRAEGTFKNKKDYDTMFHNHPDVRTATASAGDWAAFANEFDNFKRQIIVTKDEMATFDFSALTKKEMQEVANAIQSALKSAVPDKQWLKDVEVYGKEEATNMWNRRVTSGVLEKYPGVKTNVESTSRLFPSVQDNAAKDVRIDGIEKLTSSISGLQQAIENAIGVIKKSEENGQKQKQKDSDGESKKKQAVDTFDVDKDKAAKSLNAYRNALNKDFITDNAFAQISELEAKLDSITDAGQLNVWQQEWNEVTRSISQASKEAESLVKNKQKMALKGVSNSLQKAYKDAKIDPLSANEDDKAIIERYTNLMAELDTYSQKDSSAIDKAKIQSLKEEASALQKAMEKRAEYNRQQAEELAQKKAAQKQEEALEKEKEKQQKAFEKSQKAEEDRMYRLFGAADNAGIANSDAGVAAIKKVEDAWRDLSAAQIEANNTEGGPSPEQIRNLGNLESAYKKSTEALKGLITETNNLDKNAIWSSPVNAAGLDRSGRIQAITDAIQAQYGGKAKIIDKSADGYQVNFRIKNDDGSLSQFTAQMNQAGTAIVATQSKLKSFDGVIKGFFKGSLRKMGDALKVFSGYDLVFRGIAEVKKGIQYVTEIDTALTELKKVTNETDATYDKFLNTMSQTGSKIGATVKDLTTMSADWARLGYSIEEAGKLAESTAILLNVSEFTSAEDASEALISSMQAFGIAAEDSMGVVDILNEVKFTCLLIQ